MSETLASSIWSWWILAWVGGSFLALEFGSIGWAHLAGQKNVYEWTLSDTVRRWSSMYNWLALVVIGGSAALMFHLFGQSNP